MAYIFFFILKYALFIFSATNLRKTNLQKHEDENVTIDFDLMFSSVSDAFWI